MDKTDRELLLEIHTALAVLTSEVGSACKRLDEVCGDVYGNHKPGLKNDVTVLKTKVNFAQWLGGAAGGAGISALVASILALVLK